MADPVTRSLALNAWHTVRRMAYEHEYCCREEVTSYSYRRIGMPNYRGAFDNYYAALDFYN